MDAISDEGMCHRTLILVGELSDILFVAVWLGYLVRLFKPIGTVAFKIPSEHFHFPRQPVGTGLDWHARGVKALGKQDLLPLGPRYPACEIDL